MTAFRDRLTFEAPWAVAAALVLSAVLMPFHPLFGVWPATILPGLALAAIAFAAGVRKPGPLVGLVFVTSLLALVVPPLVLALLIWAVALVAALALALLRWNFPCHAARVKSGQSYAFAGIDHAMPVLVHEGRPGFLLRPSLARDLIELAAYSAAFLDRHQIGFVIGYGTLLGAVRHRGLIPWDDDIDFILYRSADIERLDREIEALQQEVAQNGYLLFRHNDYWKIAKRGYWRYPCVDLFTNVDLLEPQVQPVRVEWEGLSLPAPPEPERILLAHYGTDCLERSILDLPFWDSGFVPSAVSRLLGNGLLDRLGAVYTALFAPRAK